MSSANKRALSATHSVSNTKPEPECLIIPGTNGEDIMLIPCGAIDGCTLYVESHDPCPPEVGSQGPGLHFGA